MSEKHVHDIFSNDTSLGRRAAIFAGVSLHDCMDTQVHIILYAISQYTADKRRVLRRG